MQNNLYEYTRAVRFNLYGEDRKVFVPNNSSLDLKKTLDDFIQYYEYVLSDFHTAFLVEVEGEKRVKDKIELKRDFVFHHCGDRFREMEMKPTREYEKNKPKTYRLTDFREDFVEWYQRNQELYIKVEEICSQPLESQSRRSDLAFVVRQINSKENFGFVRSLVLPGVVKDKVTDKNINNLKQSSDNLERTLEELMFLVAPDQSNGLEVARASFNYFAVNKAVTNFDDKEKEIKQKLTDEFDLSGQDKKIFKEVGFNPKNLALESLYSEMKEWKAEQKAQFEKAVKQRDLLEEELVDKFPIFGNLAAVEKYAEFTDGIEDASEEFNRTKNKSFKRKVSDLKKWRGKLMMFRTQKDKRTKELHPGFDNWVSFSDIFKKVAINLGKVKAELRALEQEKIEMKLLNYWALILKQSDKRKLLLVPKEKMREVKKALEVAEDNTGDVVAMFSSITLKAVEKLIRRNLDKEVPDLQDDQKAIELYKEVLRGDFSAKGLNLRVEQPELFTSDLEGLLRQDFTGKTKEDFRQAFEKLTYIKTRYNTIESLKSRFGILELEISSYDLERDLQGDKKTHTKLWEEFWSQEQDFATRLNPEVRIFYRAKQENLPTEKAKNRFSQEHFGVTFTITENVGTKNNQNAFLEEKGLEEQIRKFNGTVVADFVKEKGDDLWYFGIDRGTTELATLCVTKFSKENYEVTLTDNTVRHFKTPIPALITVYEIKQEYLNKTKEIPKDNKGNTTVVTAYKNPSYFIDDEEIFEKKEVACIDLTAAKLIKDKIVLNGDLATYIALKKANGKRQLFEKVSQIQEGASIEYYDEYGQFKIEKKDGKQVPLPYYSKITKEGYSQEEMQADLQVYLDDLRGGKPIEEIEIEKINHLRDAITANMVGIIAYLFEQYPGIINLENLHTVQHIEDHFRKNNEDISRRLEWSLYRKFQKFGLVPPNLRQTIFLREKDEKGKSKNNQNNNQKGRQEHKEEDKNLLNQIGIIHFIKTDSTSARCPRCGEGTPKSQRKKDKFAEHIYTCRGGDKNKFVNCGFTTENPETPFEFLAGGSDSAAAYNIAKMQI